MWIQIVVIINQWPFLVGYIALSIIKRPPELIDTIVWYCPTRNEISVALEYSRRLRKICISVPKGDNHSCNSRGTLALNIGNSGIGNQYKESTKWIKWMDHVKVIALVRRNQGLVYLFTNRQTVRIFSPKIEKRTTNSLIVYDILIH